MTKFPLTRLGQWSCHSNPKEARNTSVVLLEREKNLIEAMKDKNIELLKYKIWKLPLVGMFQNLVWPKQHLTGFRGRAVYGPGLLPLSCWDLCSNPAEGIYVFCECCVLSGRGLCNGLTTRPKESYRLWRVVANDLETWKMRRLLPPSVHRAHKKQYLAPFHLNYALVWTTDVSCFDFHC